MNEPLHPAAQQHNPPPGYPQDPTGGWHRPPAAPQPPPRRDLSTSTVVWIALGLLAAVTAASIGIVVYRKNLGSSVEAGYDACQEAVTARLDRPATFTGFAYYQGETRDKIRGKVSAADARGVPVWADVECAVERTSDGWKVLDVRIAEP